MGSRLQWMMVLGMMVMSTLPQEVSAQRDINGNSWTRWNNDRKMAYVVGFYAGLKADYRAFLDAEKHYGLKSTNPVPPVVIDVYKRDRDAFYADRIKYNFKQLIEILNVFYDIELNRLIPLPAAIKISMLEQDNQRNRSKALLIEERRKILKNR